MQIDSWAFAAFISIGLLLFHIVRQEDWRIGVLVGLSAAFIVSHFPSPQASLGFAGFAALTVGCIYWVAHFPRRYGSMIAIVAIVSLFLLIKGYLALLGVPTFPITYTLGASYILFRSIQVLADLNDGTLHPRQLRLPHLLLHMFLFLTLPAGPIARYEDIKEQLDRLSTVKLRHIDAGSVLFRLTLGYAKIAFAAPLLLSAHGYWAAQSAISAPALALAAIIFIGYVYVNFSGYMDVIVSIGCCFGFNLPENFNRPYLARTYLDIWNRWHITLSRTFQTYLFYPIVRALTPRLGASLPAGLVAYMVVFFLLGFWHGATSAYALFGVLLGIGAITTKLIEVLLDDRSPDGWISSLRETTIWAAAANASAIAWFAIASIGAWPSIADASGVLRIAAGSGSLAHAGYAIIIAFFALIVLNLLVRLCALTVRRLPLPEIPAALWHPTLAGCLIVIAVASAALAPQEFSTLVLYQRY